MNTRIIKQSTIFIVFAFIIASVSYFSYQKLSSSENLCANKVQDPKEEGVDCGAFCKKPCLEIRDLEISDKKLIKVAVFSGQTITWDYDALIELKNPNFSHGAQGLYQINFLNQSGESILTKSGSFYILPGERKYIIESPVKTSQEILSFDFLITQIDWQKEAGYSGKTIFPSQRQEYEVLEKPNEFSHLQGVVFNDSNFSFDKVDIVVLLFDKDDRILAAGKTDLRSFESKTSRFFEIKWPNQFEGEAARIDVQSYTNLLDDSNFLKGSEGIQNF